MGAASRERCYVGLDLGTSSMKGVVIDRSGAVISQARASYETARPTPGAAEQTPRDWLAAMRAVLSTLVRSAAPATIGVVGLSGMMPTLVTLDRRGELCGPAITWEDRRAERYGPGYTDSAASQRTYETTGQWVDGRYLVPMFLRLLDDEPERAARSSACCSAKDFLFFHLTGELVTDPSTASGSGCFALSEGRYDSALVEAATARAGCTLPRLPAVVPSTCVRPMRPEVAAELGLRDVDVCLGAADSVLGALGVGALGVGALGVGALGVGAVEDGAVEDGERGEGSIAYLSGTSTVILARLDRFAPGAGDRLLVTPALGDAPYAFEADLLSTGSSIAWLAELAGTGTSVSEAIALASAWDPRDAPVFLPYLAGGEQGALWDETVAGTVLGLRLRDGATQLMRGLLTGIVLESKRCIDAIASAGAGAAEIRAAGGLPEAPGFRRDLADAIGVQVTTPACGGAEVSALGAALLAAASEGIGVPVARSGGETSVPTPRRTEVWEGLWARHEASRAAVSPLYRDWGADAGSRGADPGSRGVGTESTTRLGS